MKCHDIVKLYTSTCMLFVCCLGCSFFFRNSQKSNWMQSWSVTLKTEIEMAYTLIDQL